MCWMKDDFQQLESRKAFITKLWIFFNTVSQNTESIEEKP